MALWTVRQLATLLDARGDFDDTPVSGISIDSRTLKPGDVFVALSGTPGGGFVSSFASSGDGHQWLRKAAEMGAAAAIVSEWQEGLPIPQLVVKDTLLDGLWKVAEAARRRFGGKVVGLTGSAGKSSTKELLAKMLPGAHASPASYNNFWGVPLTLANMPPEAAYAVVEMGMNRPGEIARLSQLVRPDVALVVNIKPVHLEALGSLEAIRQEKLSIRRGLVPGGTLVIPADTSMDGLDSLPAQTLRFGMDRGSGAQVYALDWHAHGDDWHVDADVDGDKIDFMLPQGAPHKLNNALAALGVCAVLGVDVANAAGRIALVNAMPGRGVVQQAGGITLIDDSFNANPASVGAALQAMVARPVKGRRIAILGDMLELGSEGPAFHAALAAECRHLDGVVCVGPLMKNLYEALPAGLGIAYYPDPDKVSADALARHLIPGDMVAIKGSKKIFWVKDMARKLLDELKK